MLGLLEKAWNFVLGVKSLVNDLVIFRESKF